MGSAVTGVEVMVPGNSLGFCGGFDTAALLKEQTMPAKWNTGKPPNEKLVEVDLDGEIIRVKAFFGRDGYLPHWRSEDETKMWHPSTFREWREIVTEAAGKAV